MARTNAVGKESVFSGGALRLPCAAEKLAALLAAEAQWLKKLQRTRAQLGKLQADLQELTAKMQSATQPLIEKCRALDEQIHAVFAQLLSSESGLAKRARQRVQRCYENLQSSGFLSDRVPFNECGDVSDIFGGAFPYDAGAEGFSPFDDPCQQRSADLHKGRDRQASRDLFRKLAEYLHPDKCHACEDIEDRLRREDAMKEASIAYREGDLGRLMAIEKAWLEGRAVPRAPAGDDLEARCAAMKARLMELVDQERTLRADLRDLRRVPEMNLLRDIKRFGEPEVFARLAQDMEAEAQDLSESLACAKAFAAKRITLEQFLAGPAVIRGCDDAAALDCGLQDLRDLQDYIDSFAAASSQSNRKAKAKSNLRR